MNKQQKIALTASAFKAYQTGESILDAELDAALETLPGTVDLLSALGPEFRFERNSLLFTLEAFRSFKAERKKMKYTP